MSESESHHHGKNEIIIIKRHGGGHGGHHGGAWKIAYADFMTAMMAFFLVMWLVNAANEDTKAAVASYFNPMKLTDPKPAEEGKKKPAKDAEGQETQDKAKEKNENQSLGKGADSGDQKSTAAGEAVKDAEAQFFDDPYSVLSDIVQEVEKQTNPEEKPREAVDKAGPASGADGGEAYRDPFDPDFWEKQVEVTDVQEIQAPKDSGKTGTGTMDIAELGQPSTAEELAKSLEDPGINSTTVDAKAAELAQKLEEQRLQEEKQAAEAEKAAAKADAAALQKELAQAVSGVSGRLAEGLQVTPAEGGMLVSISDQVDTPMFNVGSAIPKRDTILAMEKIGKILSERKGQIAIRGHTDGRQYKKGEGDNWSLSMSRAHSAYFMLMRAGLDEKRVSQVTGFADTRLQVPDDPMNDANRRIEILIQAPTDQG